MSAEYMHIGIPVINKKPGMVYNEWGKFWVNPSVDEYDYKIEYLKFEEGSRFPEVIGKLFHVAYKVDDMEPYLAKAPVRGIRPGGALRNGETGLCVYGRRSYRTLRREEIVFPSLP
jgi:hypothetical protein